MERVGEAGPVVSAGRLVPFLCASGVVCVPFLVVSAVLVLVEVDLEVLSAGSWAVLSWSDGSSSIGEGRGGGMLVPSVREPNLRSRAGSWNLGGRLAVALLLPFMRAVILACFRNGTLVCWLVWMEEGAIGEVESGSLRWVIKSRDGKTSGWI